MLALIYISEPTQEFSAQELRELNSKAISFNTQEHITGFLCFHHEQFIQYIEGEPSEINALFEKIADDSRHRIQFKLQDTSLPSRRFPSWSMKFISSELLSEFSVEPFLHKQLNIMKQTSLNDEAWSQMVWRGVDILANNRTKIAS